jgi:hypothetical protein
VVIHQTNGICPKHAADFLFAISRSLHSSAGADQVIGCTFFCQHSWQSLIRSVHSQTADVMEEDLWLKMHSQSGVYGVPECWFVFFMQVVCQSTGCLVT